MIKIERGSKMLTIESSLEDFQSRNDELYRVVNDRKYDVLEMFRYLHYHITAALKVVRKESYEGLEWQLCMAMSWSFAIFNRFWLNLADEAWERFPGHCPYCREAPCSCKTRRKDRSLFGPENGERPVSLKDWQTMFWKIYPNEVLRSAIHMAEEAGEVNDALHEYLQADVYKDHWFKTVVDELVDVVTHIFAVASCRQINLTEFMVQYFARHCPGCRGEPCICRSVLAKPPPKR